MSQAHWTDKYVGMKVIPGQFDCANLAELVQREVFNRVVNIPKDREYTREGLSKLEQFKAMRDQINRLKASVCYKTAIPSEGDGVLLFARGYSQHIGIYTVTAGERWVLHAADFDVGPQVVLQRVRELPVKGLKIEGYYRWI